MRIATGTSVLVLVTSGVGHAVVSDLDAQVHRVDPFVGLTDRPDDTDGLNVLVVGTDGREKLSAEEKQRYHLGGAACDCTDTLMLVHLSAGGKRASVVSLPRDTLAKLPAHRDKHTGKQVGATRAKLNSAYTAGGPSLTVRTVEQLTKVHVDHYVEVDFTSFMKTVDVLGGVPVCTDRRLRDSHSGLDLKKGTTTLGGGEALQYVRARHVDGGSDLNRIRRQQRFLGALVAKATDSGVLMNPVKFNKVASTVLNSVSADRGLGAEEMVSLGRALRGFTPSSAEFASVPLADPDHRVPGLGSTVRWDDAKATLLFRALREDAPLASVTEDGSGSGHAGKGSSQDEKEHPKGAEDNAPREKNDVAAGGPAASVEVAPSQVRVAVVNGTSRQGLGRRVDTALRQTGFATTGTPSNAPGDGEEKATTLTYDPRWDRSAKALAAALPGARLKEEAGRGPLMKVTLGTEHHAVRKVVSHSPSTDSRRLHATTGDSVGCD